MFVLLLLLSPTSSWPLLPWAPSLRITTVAVKAHLARGWWSLAHLIGLLRQLRPTPFLSSPLLSLQFQLQLHPERRSYLAGSGGIKAEPGRASSDHTTTNTRQVIIRRALLTAPQLNAGQPTLPLSVKFHGAAVILRFALFVCSKLPAMETNQRGGNACTRFTRRQK